MLECKQQDIKAHCFQLSSTKHDYAAVMHEKFLLFLYQQAREMPWLPQVILGVCSIAAGFAALILPETRWLPLPDTVEEVEMRDGKRSANKQTSAQKMDSDNSQEPENINATEM